MAWDRALYKALRAVGVPSTFTKWRDLAAYCDQWRVSARPRREGQFTLLHFDFDFCLSTSIPVLTTSTCVVAWPQGDQFLGGGM